MALFSELKVALAKLGADFTDSQSKEILKLLDKDKNGRITFDEFLKVIASGPFYMFFNTNKFRASSQKFFERCC